MCLAFSNRVAMLACSHALPNDSEAHTAYLQDGRVLDSLRFLRHLVRRQVCAGGLSEGLRLHVFSGSTGSGYMLHK